MDPDHSRSDSQTLLISSTKQSTKGYPLANLLALTIAFLGIQFSWSVQVGYVTKTLEERLGLDKRFVSYAWLAGPVAGIVVQPTVGLLSDRLHTRFGRRRPYIFGGSIVACFALISFAWADRLWVGILSFWVLDFAINAAQGPLRALMTDVVPSEEQGRGNAYFALMSGVGNASGNLLGSLPLSKVFGGRVEDVQVLYVMAAVILLTTVSICCFVTKEDVPATGWAYENVDTVEDGEVSANDAGYSRESVDVSMSLWQATASAPKPFWRLFVIQNFQWFAWFCVFIFTTSWVGVSVFGGDPTKPEGHVKRELYDEGVRFGNLGLGMQAVVSILFSAILPSLLTKYGEVSVYFLSISVHGLAMICTLFLVGRGSAPFALMCIAALGIPWATTMTVPWAMVGRAVAKSAPASAGIFATIFNLAQCFPEIAVSLLSEELVRWSGKEVTVIAVGGVVALAGAALIFVLRIDQNDEQR